MSSLLLGMGFSLAALGLAAGWPPAAQQESNFTLEGKITEKAPGKLTLTAGENILFHVHYDDRTQIKRADGSPGSAKDFRVGLKVRVEGNLTESGVIDARKIEIKEEPPSKQSSPGR